LSDVIGLIFFERSPTCGGRAALRDTDRVAQILAATDDRGESPRRLRLLIAWCLITGCGLLLVVVGSFLPWVISGTVKRSSYEIVGVLERLGFAQDGLVAVAVGAWPFLGVLCFAPVVTGALRWWRSTGVLAVVIGLFAATLSIGILLFAVRTGGLPVRLDPIGPSVMAAGGLLLIGGGIGTTFGNSFTRPPQRSSMLST
jgi:uncharacterized membrane protein